MRTFTVTVKLELSDKLDTGVEPIEEWIEYALMNGFRNYITTELGEKVEALSIEEDK